MTLTLQYILDFLSKNKIGYKIKNENAAVAGKEFALASIKNKIDNGLYYLTGELCKEAAHIHHSIIFCDQEEVTADSNIYLLVNNPQLVHYKLSSLFEM